jgi:hypothetical protein
MGPQKESVFSRLQRQKQDSISVLHGRSLRDIPGTEEWFHKKEVENPALDRDTRSRYNALSPEDQKKWTQSIQSAASPDPSLRTNQSLVDNIVNYTNAYDWQCIQGGKHDGMWVNKRYPNKIFDTGAVYDKIAGSWEYFPRSSTERDPEGMALHYELSSAGNTFAIIPNAWTAQEDTRRGRRERKATYRFQKRRDKKTRFEDLTK